MTIGVATPKGRVGAHVLRLLVQAGERPRALLREPKSLDPVVADRVDAVRMDVWDADSVAEATRDLSAIYWVSPTAMDRDPLDAHALAARNLAGAIEENRIERVVFQSSGGAEKRHGVGEIDGLAATELAIEGTDAAVTHLRCGYFFSNLLMDLESIRQGVLVTAMDLDRALPWVAPSDIAAVATARLLSRSWTGRNVVGVHGPEDLSFRRVAATLSGVLGHPVVPEQVGDDDVREQLRAAGLPRAQVEAIVMMTAGIRDDDFTEQPRSYATTTPTSLRAWAAAHLAPDGR